MKKSIVASALLSTLVGYSAIAADINFSGYGSFRAGMTLDDNYIPPDFGYDDEVDFKNESLFALQAQTQINDKWSATVVLQASGDDDFDLEARWAYLNYDLTPDTIISIGRFALPYFRSSDTQAIGYSHNYSRMPSAIYKGQEFEIVEGVRVMHSAFIGDGEITLKGSFSNFSGSVDLDLGSADAEFNNIIQFSAEYTYDWFSIYAGALTTEVSIDMNSLLDSGLSAALPGYSVIDSTVYNPSQVAVYDMQDMYVEEDTATYLSTGITIDYNQWLINAEYALYGIDDSLMQDLSAYYISVAYRFDKFTVSAVHQDFSVSFDHEHANSIDPFVNAYSTSVATALFINEEFDSQGIHLRYDVANNIAYKFEYTNVNGDYADESTGIVTMGVDFLF